MSGTSPVRSALRAVSQELSDFQPVEAPLLTVIVPVFNEHKTIGELLRRVAAMRLEKQVVVVDDCSTDGTPNILQDLRRRLPIEVVTHKINCGKGRAIRTGLEQARGRFTIIQDADLEYDPEDYKHIIEPLVSGRARAVFGSRYLCKSALSRLNFFRLGVSLLNLCVRILYGARLTDQATCYKAFPTNVLCAMDLQCERFEYCAEVTAKALRMGMLIHEVPISYQPRSIQDGKKIRYRDGVSAILSLWRWRKWQPLLGSADSKPANEEVCVIGPEASSGCTSD
jgi:dolichol-phosphate mannosyltransferase